MVTLALTAVACLPRPAAAAGPAGRAVPRGLDEAVERGLAHLARQQRADGSFDADARDDGEPLRLSKGGRHALTGLTVLAFLSAGHTPDVGRYGITVRNAMDFLAAAVPEDGYVGRADVNKDDKQFGMYTQAIVTLALAEAAGVEPDPARRRRQDAALRKLVGVLLKAQDVKKDGAYAGGWRYTPTADDSDVSLSGWCALALRAAQDVGVPVSKDALARAADFVLRCYNKEQKGFGYQPGTPAKTSPTGTAVLCLHLLDRGGTAEAKDGAKFITDHPTEESPQFPYYALFYATQAAWQAGDEAWAKVSAATFGQLIGNGKQSSDGGWPGDTPGQEPGRVYRTAMAVLTLTVPYRLLPIYQR